MRTLMIVTMACLVWAAATPVSGAAPPAVGDAFPEITLDAPADRAHQAYLGLRAAAPFPLRQIPGDALIVQIFSMYCPYCQKEAPRVNALYRRIGERPDTVGRVKLIGIGAGNSPMEVALYRKTYEIAFPLFPDGDLSIHATVGEVRTPYFFVLRRGTDGAYQVIATHLGAIEDVDAYLDGIVKALGRQP